MKKKFFLLLLFFFLTQFESYAQKINIEETYIQKIKTYKSINNDSVFYYSKKLQRSKNLCNIYRGKICEALYYYNENKIEKSKKISEDIIKDLQKKEDFCLKKITIEAYNRLFWIHKNQNNFNEAFENIKAIQNINNTISKSSTYYITLSFTSKINMATIKILLGHYEDAITLLKNNLIDYSKIDSNSTVLSHHSRILNKSSAYNLIGEAYLNSSEDDKSSQLDSASYYFKKAYQTAKKFNPPHKDSETLYNLKEAEVLIAKKKFKQSLSLIQKYSKNSKEFNTVQNINSLKAICFYNLNKKDSAFFYAKSFLKNFNKNINNKERLIAIYDILSNLYFTEKRLDSAFKYSELTIAELKLLDKTKNEVNKSHYLHNYNDIQNLNADILKKGKNNNNLFILLFCVALLSFAMIYLYIQRKNKGIIKDLKNITKKQTPQKKEYNIDLELEQTILQGITALKKSTDFLNTDFNIQSLSKQLNTNTSYVSYIINKEFNQSFKEYLTQLRIEYLIERLKNDKAYKKYTIKSLAEEIGYTNASAFTRAFKKLKGITPSEFIKSID